MLDARLLEMFHRHPRWVVLTGAGISAASGIPTYRDDRGQWQRSNPIQHQEFLEQPAMRQRYWARSMLGWRFVQQSSPNRAHYALRQLEDQGRVALLVTQNVDRLHQRAGSRRVVDLHGRLDRVSCRNCQQEQDRDALQVQLLELNPGFARRQAERRPDGDADVPDRWLNGFRVPSCTHCGGMLMPAVVFFGGSVPRERVAQVTDAVHAAQGLLVLGSSLTVYSGFRFCRQAVAAGKPLVIINRGVTRADDLASLKVVGDCADLLEPLTKALADSAVPATATGMAAQSLKGAPAGDSTDNSHINKGTRG